MSDTQHVDMEIIDLLELQTTPITSYSQFTTLTGTLTSANNYWAWILELTASFDYDEVSYKDGDLIYWLDDEWNVVSNIYDEDTPYQYEEKYLSILTSRFFGSDLANSYPNFVQFCKEWLVQCDTGFWKFASKISSFSDVDKVPDEMLLLFLTQYAINFSTYANKIPYFYDEDTSTWNYDNIRHFLRLARKFALTKGSTQSLFFLFEMFEGKLVLRFPYKQLLVLSDIKPVYKIDANGMFEFVTEMDGSIQYSEGSYISCRDNDSEHSLYHLHGEDEESGIKWAYYTAILQTDLDIDKYKEVIESLIKPSGIQYFWEQLGITKVSGEQYSESDFIVIDNAELIPLTIDDIELPEDYEGILMGRDSEYSSIISGFQVPGLSNVVILYRYTGKITNWVSTSFSIYSDAVEYMNVEIG